MKDFIVRDFRANFKKSMLQLFVIAVSAALTMGILILHGTMSKRISVLSDKTGLESTITATSEELFEEKLIEQIENMDGVIRVAPQIEYSAEGVIHEQFKNLWLLGVTKEFIDIDNLQLLEGSSIDFSSDELEMLVDHKVAIRENISVGDEISVAINGEDVTCKVVGIYKRNRFSMQPCYEFYVNGQILQKKLKEEGKYNKVNVVTNDQDFQTISRICEQLKEAMGENVACESVIDRRANAERDLSSFSMILWAVLAILILGSMYLIYSTFCIRMDERIKTIAVLKTLGAKEKQIKSAFLKEGLLLGAIGGVLGEIVGVLVGLCLCYFYAEKDYSDVGQYFTIKVVYIIGCILIGMVVCYFGSVQPIQRASKISPISALKNVASQQHQKINVKKQLLGFAIGVILLVIVLVLSKQAIQLDSEGLIYLYMVVLGLGSVLAMILMIPYVITLICKMIFCRAKGKDAVELYLATQNLANNRNNSTIIMSIIVAGIMIIASLHGMFSSARESVENYVTDAFANEYLIDCMTRDQEEYDETLKLFEDTGVIKNYTDIDVYNYDDELSGKTFRVFGVDPEVYDNYSRLKLYAKDKEISFKDLASDNKICFVSRQIMIENQYHIGDIIKYDQDGEDLELTIAAYFSSFTNDGRLIYMSQDNLKQIDKGSESTMFCMNKRDGVSAEEFEDAIRTALDKREFSLLSVSGFAYTWKNDVIKGTEIFYIIFAMITVFVIFSLFNNYITSILQRRSEVGMLSSLGARRKSIRKIFTYEMLIMYLATLLLGGGGSYATLYIFVQCLSAVFHADLSVYYPCEIMVTSGILLLVSFILLNCIIITRILKINEVQLIKERSI